MLICWALFVYTVVSAHASQLELLTKKVEALEAKLAALDLRANDWVRRSCHELFTSNPFLHSGMYWIDPDGQGFGRAPILVHCDMKTGTTVIQHDSEAPTTVEQCQKPGCYGRSVDYSFPADQLAALMDLSAQCHQTVKYECQNAPWVLKGVAQSWWLDRQGVARYFCLDGSIDDSDVTAPVCQCHCGGVGNDGASSSGRAVDICVIKNKSLLPVTALYFGGQGSKWTGRHTLGRIECTGSARPAQNVEGLPSNCQDLRILGHSLSGFYSVRTRDGQMSTVFCDMSRPSTDLDHQRWMGYNGVKSVPVFFYVLRQSSYNIRDGAIPFEMERLNMGGGMNVETGIFSAPSAGIYFFSFVGLRPPSSASAKVALRLVNSQQGDGELVSWSQKPPGDGRHGFSTLSLQSTIQLDRGDQVGLFLLSGVLSDSSAEHYTHFSGFLLHET